MLNDIRNIYRKKIERTKRSTCSERETLVNTPIYLI